MLKVLLVFSFLSSKLLSSNLICSVFITLSSQIVRNKVVLMFWQIRVFTAPKWPKSTTAAWRFSAQPPPLLISFSNLEHLIYVNIVMCWFVWQPHLCFHLGQIYWSTNSIRGRRGDKQSARHRHAPDLWCQSSHNRMQQQPADNSSPLAGGAKKKKSILHLQT